MPPVTDCPERLRLAALYGELLAVMAQTGESEDVRLCESVWADLERHIRKHECFRDWFKERSSQTDRTFEQGGFDLGPAS